LGGISGEFSSIPVTRRRHPDNEQKNRDAQSAPKNGQKPKPSRWPAYTSSAHRKGQKPSPRGGVVFSMRTGDRPTYLPRIVGDKLMMPADLKRLHKYMLDVEHIGGPESL
jgi:hypothetical protein